MGFVTLILFMTIIGAAIGGVTNHIAIKMLFRPHNPIYIGGMRLPFTPGLIPKRRDELAIQLGRMVVDHLLTAEGIRKKFTNPAFIKDMEAWAQTEVRRFLESEKMLVQWLDQFGISNIEGKVEGKLMDFIEARYEELVGQARVKSLGDALPEQWLSIVDTKIPEFTSYVLNKGIDYFESAEGRQRLSMMINDFLKNLGSLGSMVQMFLSNESIANSVQPELVKFLNHKGTHNMLTQMLDKEWDKVKEIKVEAIEEKIGRDQLLIFLKTQINEQLPYKKWLHSSIGQLTSPYKEDILQKWIPTAIEKAGQFIANRTEEIMERLHLAEIVRTQVEGFPVERLEDIVLSISKKEFKMITVLGALLGGIIGILQGIIVYFVG